MVSVLRSEALPVRPPFQARRIRDAADDRAPHHETRPWRPRESTAPRSPALPRNLVGLEVLVVDDDEDSLEYFAAALRACGASVTTASTAPDALALVRERNPHVVLSDIAMIGHDGYWLVGEIRSLPAGHAHDLPVVATTAYGQEHPRSRALAAGFNELIAKPVDPEVLCQTIAKMAGR
jgi:CheY-like chemotaxis protein